MKYKNPLFPFYRQEAEALGGLKCAEVTQLVSERATIKAKQFGPTAHAPAPVISDSE